VYRRPTLAAKADFLLHKDAALALAADRVAFFCRIYGVQVNTIRIRNQRTRWGSCSQKGNLSLNYRIALLPMHLVDYIIVHEVCHLKEFNHSQRFWDLVMQTVPDPVACKKELLVCMRQLVK